MSETTCDIRIGTSGWHYDHWKERFYPAGLAKSKWFEHYARHFDTVEINNTFYRLPKPEMVVRWRQLAPKGFLYSVKANRYITHIKRLKDVSEAIKRFYDVVGLFKGTLGPVLYQLPPNLKIDLDLLATFIKLLPKKPPVAFEFRNDSWYESETFELMGKHDLAFCIHDMPGKESPRQVTANRIYIRFHGTTGKYSGNYPDAELRKWARWLKQQSKTARAIYAYFNNDVYAYAIKNAKKLHEIVVK
ncbi:MAG: DUF72 domain-containing protein [Planctomycetota bacterium]|jgi:uncharacterized protein YecE (DUF72 family)